MLYLLRVVVLILWSVPSSAALAAPPYHTPPPSKLLASSGDAYVREMRTANGRQWRFGTVQVEKRVQFEDGHLSLVSFLDRTTHTEYVQGSSDILDFTWNGDTVSGRATTWILDSVRIRQLKHGEVMLRLLVHTPELAIVKCYLLYPKESIIQEPFTLGEATYQLTMNEGLNHLHGGVLGFDKVVWHATPRVDENAASVRLTYDSASGEEGYPGNLQVSVTYTLTPNNIL